MNLELETTGFADGKKRVNRQWLAFVDDPGVENEVINLYPDVGYQIFEGFGGAFTDSAGYVFSLMNDEAKQRLLAAYFGPGGAGYTLGRISLDSCDFSLEPYEAMSDPNDKFLSSFSLSRAGQYVFPLIQAAEKTLGQSLSLIAAPWSPPAFMKTTGQRNHGGKLRSEHRAFWADYLARYVTELRRQGFNLRRLTIQNEPKAAQSWDSCVYTAEEEKVFIRDFLVPALRKNNLHDLELFLWDHNKERVYERARDILDRDLLSLVTGVAFHWYSGDHFEALDLIREKFPGKKLIQTEACVEYSKADRNNLFKWAEKYAQDIIGDLNAGMTAFYDWNILLDERGGPNHVGNFCDAPFLYHTDTGTLEERISYSYITHFSRYIRPGAQRIGFSRYSSDIGVTAFQNTDGTIAAVFLNQTGAAQWVNLRIEGRLTGFSLPPSSITTGVLA
ncbi:glycosyl hydrolase [Spirochaetia bacterium]|nr:glycosyl hydrolase [Spirochaetia bacterium]